MDTTDKTKMQNELAKALKKANDAKMIFKAVGPDFLTLIQFFTEDEELMKLLSQFKAEIVKVVRPSIEEAQDYKFNRKMAYIEKIMEKHGLSFLEASQAYANMKGSVSFSIPFSPNIQR